jgi:hypothetical protein
MLATQTIDPPATTQTINKIVRIGTIAPWGTGYRASVYFRVTRGECGRAYWSFTGVIGPRISGNAAGGCGQIDMEFAHRNPADNDPRFSHLIKPADIRFAPGWDTEKWLTFLDHWKQYHLTEKPMPARVFDFLTSLPDTDRNPAWV